MVFTCQRIKNFIYGPLRSEKVHNIEISILLLSCSNQKGYDRRTNLKEIEEEESVDILDLAFGPDSTVVKPEWLNNIKFTDTMFIDPARLLFVRTKPSAIIDDFLRTIEITDIHNLYPGEFISEIKTYYLSLSTDIKDAKAPFWEHFDVTESERVNIEDAKYVTITIDEMIDIHRESKYRFAYGNLMIYTSQWIDGFFDRVEMPIKIYIGGYLCVTEYYNFWKCVYSGGKFDYQFFVFNDEEMNELGYELTKKEYHKVVRKSADD